MTQEGAGFAVDTNIVTIYGADGSAENHPKLTKDEVADLILDRIVALRARKSKSRALRAVRPTPDPFPFGRTREREFEVTRTCSLP